MKLAIFILSIGLGVCQTVLKSENFTLADRYHNYTFNLSEDISPSILEFSAEPSSLQLELRGYPSLAANSVMLSPCEFKKY